MSLIKKKYEYKLLDTLYSEIQISKSYQKLGITFNLNSHIHTAKLLICFHFTDLNTAQPQISYFLNIQGDLEITVE